jgi:coenzyme F420 hydrogenase subunit beta
MRVPSSVSEVVSTGLCIGCGLCEAVTGGRVRMTMTERGTLRPHPLSALRSDDEVAILAACPGAVAETRAAAGIPVDPIWGPVSSMRVAWAADPGIRHRAASGGVLTALGVHLVRTGQAAFVLHVGPDPQQPMRSRWVISDTPDQVLANTGSRYGPTSPLAGLVEALDRDEPFAVIAKPCDLGAIHRYARVDARLDESCVARLALVCGGQSRLTKSLAVLDTAGLEESEVTLFRYRGDGNPGPTRVEAGPDRSFETTYLDMWGNDSTWDLDARCTICPDALGEAADVSSADVWPGGAPSGEDEGFNGIVVRTSAGEHLVDAAVESGDLVLGDEIEPRQFDAFQPHQVRKKEALATRFEGREDAGLPVIETIGLRVRELGARLERAEYERQRSGTIERAVAGRYREEVE